MNRLAKNLLILNKRFIQFKIKLNILRLPYRDMLAVKMGNSKILEAKWAKIYKMSLSMNYINLLLVSEALAKRFLAYQLMKKIQDAMQ